jgi:hypothetical protein
MTLDIDNSILRAPVRNWLLLALLSLCILLGSGLGLIIHELLQTREEVTELRTSVLQSSIETFLYFWFYKNLCEYTRILDTSV